ncbi:ubiquitin-conjugating enzyme family protein [Geomonas sp. Red276]
MRPADRQGVQRFLDDYPGMTLRPCRDKGVILRGTFTFCGTPPAATQICDAYELELEVPSSFPKEIPTVKETGGRIPRDGTFHINPDDTLCLGSPLSILIRVAQEPTLTGFASKCIVPFLYAVSKRLADGGGFAFSELRHGKRGILDDYVEVLDLSGPDDVVAALKLLAMRRRVANKQPCPCNCGKRLGRCRYHFKLNRFRGMAPRSWFAFEENSLTSR